MSGTIASLKLKGLPFDVANDAEFTEVFGKFTNTVIPTSGKGSISQERRVEEVTGVIIILKVGDRKLLKDLSETGKSFSISYVHADNTAHKTVGTINIESNTTNQNRCTISLLPTEDWTVLNA